MLKSNFFWDYKLKLLKSQEKLESPATIVLTFADVVLNVWSAEALTTKYLVDVVAFDVIDTLKPSSRGEYEISDVSSWFVKNRRGRVIDIDCGWVDAGTQESYRKANEMLWDKWWKLSLDLVK